MDRYVAKALIDVALFFDSVDDDVLDPGIAVEALEQLAANLQSASDVARSDLTDAITKLAADYPRHRDFVLELPDALGLR